jgi:flagellar biosynthesis protein FlhG
MAQAGMRTVIVDADLGAANQHTLFGLDRLGASLQSLLTKQVDTLEAAVRSTGIPRLQIVAGIGAVPGAANLAHQQKQKVLRHLRALDADVVLVDVGAGSSFNVLDFFGVADLRVVVMTPQLTSIQNAYAFLKGLVLRSIGRLADRPSREQMLEFAGTHRETGRIRHLVARARETDPAFADAVGATLAAVRARLVGNQVFDSKDAGVLHAVSRMMTDFLQIPVPVLGHLRASRRVHDSVTRRRPFLLDAVDDENARSVRRIAESLLLEPIDPVDGVRLAADVQRSDVESAPLPASLAAFMRAYTRYSVDWPGHFTRGDDTWPARIFDVSTAGACVALVGEAPPLAVGATAVLTVDALPGRPRVPVVVRNVRPDGRQAGLEFTATDDVGAHIADVARMASRRAVPLPALDEASSAAARGVGA